MNGITTFGMLGPRVDSRQDGANHPKDDKAAAMPMRYMRALRKISYPCVDQAPLQRFRQGRVDGVDAGVAQDELLWKPIICLGGRRWPPRVRRETRRACYADKAAADPHLPR